MIPKQLQNSKFRFVKLGKTFLWKNGKTKEIKFFPAKKYNDIDKKVWKPLGKAPFETAWDKNGYSFDDSKLIEHIKDFNFGIICGFGNLRILDIDDEELGKELEKKLDTFTIKTGSGGRHFYFISNYNINNTLINELGEMRCSNMQVVCSPSKHPNGNLYEVINDVEIKNVNDEFLEKLLKPYLKKENVGQTKLERKNTPAIDKKFLEENVLKNLSYETINLINNQNNVCVGFRSERDEKVITTLLLNGLGDYIKPIFEIFPCGDKYREHPSPDKYLEASIEAGRKFTGIVDDETLQLEKEIDRLDRGVLKNKIDYFLLKISEIKKWLTQKHLLGIIAFKTKISKRELEKRLKELKESNEFQNPIPINSLLNKNIPEINFYLKPLIPKQSCILVGGKAEKFKSMFMLSLGVFLSSNKNFLNQFSIESKPKILYYDLENGERIMKWRLKYILNGLKISEDELKDFDITYNFKKNNLEKELEVANNYDLIILDSYRRFLEGTENDSEITDKFFNEFLKPLKDKGKTIIILHHFKKNNPEEITNDSLMDLFRGSSDIVAQFDLIYGLFKSADKINETNTITNFVVSIAKVKNRLGLPLKDFCFNVNKNDSELKTTFDFINFEKLKSQKEQIKDEILNLLKNSNLSRYEIVKKMQEEFDCSKWSVFKYIQELVKEKFIVRTKYGSYSLFENSIKITEGEGQTKINTDV